MTAAIQSDPITNWIDTALEVVAGIQIASAVIEVVAAKAVTSAALPPLGFALAALAIVKCLGRGFTPQTPRYIAAGALGALGAVAGSALVS